MWLAAGGVDTGSKKPDANEGELARPLGRAQENATTEPSLTVGLAPDPALLQKSRRHQVRDLRWILDLLLAHPLVSLRD